LLTVTPRTPQNALLPDRHGCGAPIRGGIAVLFAIIRVSSRRPKEPRLAAPGKRGVNGLCAAQVRHVAHGRRGMSPSGPNNRHNRLSGGLVPPCKYRKYRTELLLHILGNITSLCRVNYLARRPDCLLPLNPQHFTGHPCFLLGRIMFLTLRIERRLADFKGRSARRNARPRSADRHSMRPGRRAEGEVTAAGP